LLTWIRKRQNFIPAGTARNLIKNQVVSGSLWSGLDVGFQVGLSFVRSIILARLLEPEDFGIISISIVFTEFILIFTNLGFNASVVYYRDLNKDDISTCWWGNLIINSLAVIVIISLAFTSRDFIKTPQIPWVVMLLSLQFVITGFGSINQSLAQRIFKFKQITMIRIFSTLFGFVLTLITVIILDWGVYALVAGMISASFISTVSFFFVIPWLPSFSASWSTAKKHMKYGKWLLGVNILTYVNGNIDKMTIGLFLNNTQLGYFEYASRFPAMVVTNLGQVLNKVLFPAFSSLQDNFEELRPLIKDLFRYNALIIFPFLIGLALVADDFVLTLYGEKWEPVILPMRILSAYGILRIFTNPMYILANGIGKPNLPFKWVLISLPLNAVAFYFLAHYYGLSGIAFGKFFVPLFMICTLVVELLKIIKQSFFNLFAEALPALSSVSALAIIIVLEKISFLHLIDSGLARLIIQIISGAIVYVAMVRVFWSQDFNRLWSRVAKITGK
jgi:lipopolysaccharide exporter